MEINDSEMQPAWGPSRRGKIRLPPGTIAAGVAGVSEGRYTSPPVGKLLRTFCDDY